MGGNTSKNGPPQPSARDRAILDLKHQQDELNISRKRIQKVIDREMEMAKALIKQGKRKQAMLSLKKKKHQEQMLERVTQMLMNVEDLINSIDFAQRELEVFEALKEGKSVLQALNNEMKIEDVEKLMDDTRDAMDYQDEVSRAMEQVITAEDEADIEKELEEMLAAGKPAVAEADFPKVPDEMPQAVDSKQSLENTPGTEKGEKQAVPA
mmetsp:Transcript_4423/g.12395  ORF Transcript_4423/g.12395 Transcript_4423/m.12395 type:complete len:210 (+) Transcript_4423:48-677(+)